MQRRGAHEAGDTSAQDWLDLIAVVNSESAIARVVNEAMIDLNFEDIAKAIEAGLPTNRNLGVAAARQLSECLFDFADDFSLPMCDIDIASQREQSALDIWEAWLSSIPSGSDATAEEKRFYRSVLTACLVHAAGHSQAFAMDFFLSRGGKMLELSFLKKGSVPQLGDSGNYALASAILSYNETAKPLTFLDEIEKRTEPISFDVVDLSIAKQHSAMAIVPDCLVDSGRLLHKLCLDLHAGQIDQFEKIDWVRSRMPSGYVLPYHALWHKAVGHVQTMRQICERRINPEDYGLASEKEMEKAASSRRIIVNKMLQGAARFLAAGAQPPGDDESRASAWRHLLHDPLNFFPYGNDMAGFPDLLHALVCGAFVTLARQQTLKAIADCGALNVNALHHGTTLLHGLVKVAPSDSVETASFLLHAGAMTDIKNAEGVTALQLARESGAHSLASAFATFEAKRAIDVVLARHQIKKT
jgi:hypothetical protein